MEDTGAIPEAMPEAAEARLKWPEAAAEPDAEPDSIGRGIAELGLAIWKQANISRINNVLAVSNEP